MHERLRTEFRIAASKVGEARDIRTKNYYFSAFYGEALRQLNVHWDIDLALAWSVVQHACQAINTRLSAGDAYPVGGFPSDFGSALDSISNDLAAAFDGDVVDLAGLHDALKKVAELTFATTGNGAYLYAKGVFRLSASSASSASLPPS